MRSPGYNQPLHRFAVLMAVLTGGLVTAGALVTSNDAGLSIPDWPLAYGAMVPPFVGGIRYEFSHRVFAGCVAILTVVLAAWLWRKDCRPKVRLFGWIAVATVFAQAVLGGMTVLFRQPVAVSAAHACLAQIFFCAIVSIALFTSRWWWDQHQAPIEDTGSPQVCMLAAFTVAATFLQLVLGAVLRHHGSGVFPHLVGAGVVMVMFFWTAGTLRSRFPSSKAFTFSRRLLHSVIGLQVVLGAAAWWSRIATADYPQPMPVMITFTVMHVVTGAITLASTVVVALVSYRLLAAPERARVAAHSTAGATAQ